MTEHTKEPISYIAENLLKSENFPVKEIIGAKFFDDLGRISGHYKDIISRKKTQFLIYSEEWDMIEVGEKESEKIAEDTELVLISYDGGLLHPARKIHLHGGRLARYKSQPNKFADEISKVLMVPREKITLKF